MRTEVIAVDRENPGEGPIRRAAGVIRGGGLVAFPTETVYGLGADALSPEAARKIFQAKGRPADNPLIVHVAAKEAAALVGHLDERSRGLMDLFWPGPLTLVVRAAGRVPKEVTGGLDTVAVRMPAHPVAIALIEVSGVPIAAPSANRSGRPSPTTAGAVLEDLGGRVELILDAGPTAVGVESTVLDVTGDHPVLLRPGGVSLEDLDEAAGPVLLPTGGRGEERSPGTRYRHYAPSIPVILVEAGKARTGEPGLPGGGAPAAYVGMSPPPAGVVAAARFASVEEYAKGLFSALRELERSGAEVILAELPAGEGVGLAVRDRLARAASGAEGPLDHWP
ncbi:MAG: L-threonylcarbamoyladenylate synthase [Thermovirgaceae bacterium]|nr:L-threonylcarbamoyladenylate synthase [Synergistales bacterium]